MWPEPMREEQRMGAGFHRGSGIALHQAQGHEPIGQDAASVQVHVAVV